MLTSLRLQNNLKVSFFTYSVLSPDLKSILKGPPKAAGFSPCSKQNGSSPITAFASQNSSIVGPGASEEDGGGTKVGKRCMGEEQKEREGKAGRGWG